jgi:glucosamine-6-phosphate deaminase
VEVVIVPDAAAGGELIAEAMAALLRRKPDALLGVATGSTPLPVYEALAAKVRSGAVDPARARVCQLDEYVGLPTGHPESYRSVVLREVVEPLGLSPGSFMGPDGAAEDVQAACEAYDAALAAAGGVDLQLLGIGTDGHIGFNEPCSSLASRTRIKTLTEQTRVDNARFFGGDIEQVPHHVITQGIGTILEARHLVLLATGEGKAEAVAQTVEGPVAAVVPASALQLHPHATVVVDEPAASKLKLAPYFRATYAAKPAWQGL